MVLVVALSLAAAFLFASSAVIQQQATRVAAGNRDEELAERRSLTARLPVLLIVRDLLRSRVWLTGWAVNLTGFFTQAAALHFGSVALVQPLLVTQLLFTLPLVSLQGRRWPLRREWLAAAGICAGVAVFLAVRGGVPHAGSADRVRILWAAGSALVLICILVIASANRPPVIHAAGVATAAGLCFALSAVFIKLTATSLLHDGVAATATDWPGYALAGSTALGLLLEQEAFGGGPLPITMTAMTISNPIASYLIGVLAFHIAPPTGGGQLAAIAGSAALLTLGTVVLASSPTVQRESETGPLAQQNLAPGVPS